MTEAVAAEAKGAVSSKEAPQLIRQSYEEVRKFADELRKKGLLKFHETEKRKGGHGEFEYYSWSTNPQRRTAREGAAIDDYTFMREQAEMRPYQDPTDNAGHMIVSDNGKTTFLEFDTVHREGPKDKQGKRLAIYGVLQPNSVRKEWFSLKPGEIIYDVFLDSPLRPTEKEHVFIKLRKGSLFARGRKGTDEEAQLVYDRLSVALRAATPHQRP